MRRLLKIAGAVVGDHKEWTQKVNAQWVTRDIFCYTYSSIDSTIYGAATGQHTQSLFPIKDILHRIWHKPAVTGAKQPVLATPLRFCHRRGVRSRFLGRISWELRVASQSVRKKALNVTVAAHEPEFMRSLSGRSDAAQ